MKTIDRIEAVPRELSRVMRYLAGISTPARRKASSRNLVKARARRWPKKRA